MLRLLIGGLAAAACTWPLAATAQTFMPQDAWYGSYQCGSRSSEVVLKITAVDEGSSTDVKASFAFGGDGIRPLGNYTVVGEYQAATRTLTLAPRGFFSLPAGYLPVGFSATLADDGVVFNGRITQANCGAITLVRGRTSAAAPRPVPPAEGPSLAPWADAPLQERFTYSDPGLLAALKLPCPERARVLERLHTDGRADPQRQVEALVALAGIEARQACQRSRSYIMQRYQDSTAPAVQADRRVAAAEAAFRQRTQALADRRPWLALWPGETLAPQGPATACPARPRLAADAATAQALAEPFENLPLGELFWALGQHRLGEAATCTRAATDGLTQTTVVNWAAVIADWRQTLALKGEGPLQRLEVTLMRKGFELVSADLERRQVARRAAEQEAAEAAAAARQRAEEQRARPTGDRR